MDRNKIGKQNRQAGQRFELKVRKDLESKGWIVSKWMNNVEIYETSRITKYSAKGDKLKKEVTYPYGKLIPAKHKFRGPGIPMSIGTGFPDFVAFTTFGGTNILHTKLGEIEGHHCVIGVECKSKGYLTKEEKAKCDWLLANNIFSKILIVSKGKKRGEIIYTEYKQK